jgi:peroxiredoxin
MSDPVQTEDLLHRQIPDLALPSTTGGRFRLRGQVGRGPLVLFFFIHHGTPG